MASIVIRLISPPSKCAGYIKRYLLEIAPHCYCGNISKKIVDELVGAVASVQARGRIGLLEHAAPFGIRWVYVHGLGDDQEVDGVVFPAPL